MKKGRILTGSGPEVSTPIQVWELSNHALMMRFKKSIKEDWKKQRKGGEGARLKPDSIVLEFEILGRMKKGVLL